jgi:DNA-binding beta-propeller fold protein YncE
MRKSHIRMVSIYFAFLFLAAAAAFIMRVSAAPAEATPQAGASGYHVVNKFKLGGEGGWDYITLEPTTHRLFISRGTHVMVVDPEKGTVLGDVTGMHRVHGIALVPEFNKGFVSDGDPGSVFIFDLTTLKVLDEVKTQPDCDGLIYDPGTKRIFTGNGDAKTATAIDAATGKVLGNVDLGGGPEFLQADGKGHLFVNLVDKSELVKVDAKALKVEATWPLAPCESPSGLAIDAAHERLFVGCHNKYMAMVDGDSGKVLGTVPIGQGVDANRFDPGTGYAFASTGDGSITVAHEDSPDKISSVDTIATQRGARTMEFDPVSHNLYTVTADFGPAPAAQPGQRPPRPPMLPDSFTLLVLAR